MDFPPGDLGDLRPRCGGGASDCIIPVGDAMSKAPPLDPSTALLCKLGSIAVHAEELLSPTGHEYDLAALRTLLTDKEVTLWLKRMGPFLPVKR